ncbi:MAG: nitroreductase family protein [Bacteroidaceae bacterium]|nr:nitroreductase family protein [Paraprevotella sp.]MDY3287887.1 nitroreductase family protein [Bacteroidaceae bacterium]MDY3891315.1 nitroreductase family protein [Bacteroidaceae bacterium]MDY4786596.1 nitroreductase family protein [Bacteroidaceae bacterium]MDY4999151.1 nitroreductase family protein [Bacteroidaceae bacterium]
MDSINKLLAVRRSHRKFTEEKVSEADVRQMVRAALIAPSSKGLHSPEVVVIEDVSTIQALSRCKDMGADFLAGAPLVIAVLADSSLSDVWIEDASVAATCLLLQAEDLGLGACWVQVRGRQTADGKDSEQTVRDLLGVPQRYGVCCLLAIGHKGMERKPQNEDRLKWEHLHTERF